MRSREVGYSADLTGCSYLRTPQNRQAMPIWSEGSLLSFGTTQHGAQKDTPPAL